MAEFATDEEASNAQYISKVIQVSGTVDRIEGNDVILATGTPDNTVRCTFDAPPAVRTGSTVAIKGERPIYLPEQQSLVSAPVYDRYRLAPGAAFSGPAVVEERESTLIVGPHARARVDALLSLVVEDAE